MALPDYAVIESGTPVVWADATDYCGMRLKEKNPNAGTQASP